MFVLISFKVHSFEEVHGDHQLGFPGIMQPSGQLLQQVSDVKVPLVPLLLGPSAVEMIPPVPV